ncbi:MAG: methionyl-tRNA formyltransferase [bacterium]|nr:methionyl-tRNA formyltransferase [bacterium]
MSWRIVFMGTPAFACPSLRALLARRDPVVGVVCQPDRPQGRGLAVTAPPVKTLALAHGVPVLQPTKVRDAAFLESLRALAPDLVVVAAYGRILPRPVLDLPPHGCINVHASLLPRHRGAAPIAHAILAGDAVTGVCIMAMAEEMDAGDVLLRRETPIRPDDTTGGLTERLAALGADALSDAIDGLQGGTLVAVPQPAEGVTFAPKLERAQARLDWTRDAAALERLVRAMQPEPIAFTTLDGRALRVFRAAADPAPAAAEPGVVVAGGRDELVVATGAGTLRLLEMQAEGKRRLHAAAFLAGRRIPPGTRLGP